MAENQPNPSALDVVDADPAAAPAGAHVVGSSLQPPAGTPPGVEANTPVVENSAADPNPTRGDMRAHDKAPQTADDPDPEATAEGSTDPAVHNPKSAPDIGTTGRVGGTPQAEHQKGTAGAAKDQHSQHGRDRPNRPARREDDLA